MFAKIIAKDCIKISRKMSWNCIAILFYKFWCRNLTKYDHILQLHSWTHRTVTIEDDNKTTFSVFDVKRKPVAQ